MLLVLEKDEFPAKITLRHANLWKTNWIVLQKNSINEKKLIVTEETVRRG